MSTTLTVRVVLFYVLSIFFVVAAVNWTTIKSGHSPFIAALNQIGIPGVALAMNIIVLTVVLSCLNSGLYVTSRALFALAAQGDAPESPIALNKRNVPGRAIIAGTVFAYGAMLTSIFLPATGLFTWLVNASGTAMLFLYAMIGIAQIRYRNGLSPEAAAKLPIEDVAVSGLSYFAVLGIGSVLVAMGMIPDLQSQLDHHAASDPGTAGDLFCLSPGPLCGGGSEPGLIRKTSPEIVLVEDNRTGGISYWQAGDHQSVADRNGVSLAEYIHALFGLLVQKRPRHVLMIGGAGGTLATMLTRRGIRVTLVDINPMAFDIARLYFHMPAEVDCQVGDGAAFLRRNTARYDAIVLDAFHEVKIPRHFLKTAFFRLVRMRLKPGGIFLINITVLDDENPCRTALAGP